MRASLLAVALLAATALSARADERPVEWSLPNQGAACRFNARFSPAPALRPRCGDGAYQVWTCTESEAGRERDVIYLVIGEIRSDAVNVCSPTFVVTQVLRQSLPTIALPPTP